MDYARPGSNSTGLQKILRLEFGVALDIWSDNCRVGQSANLGILNIWGKAGKELHSSNSKGQRGFYNYLGVFLKQKPWRFCTLGGSLGQLSGLLLVAQDAGLLSHWQYQLLTNHIVGGARLQQGNAPAHTAILITKFLEHGQWTPSIQPKVQPLCTRHGFTLKVSSYKASYLYQHTWKTNCSSF